MSAPSQARAAKPRAAAALAITMACVPFQAFAQALPPGCVTQCKEAPGQLECHTSCVAPGQFSLQCRRDGQPYYLTFDPADRTVIFETLALRRLPGRILTHDNTATTFRVAIDGQRRLDLVWDAAAGSVTWKGAVVPNMTLPHTDPCERVPARAVMDSHRGLLDFYPLD